VLESILSFIAGVTVFFRSRSDTALEVLALRQQVAVLKRKRPRPVLNSLDRLFWTALRHFWSRWADVLVIVKPETVIGWHRAGSVSIGVGDPGHAAADPRSPRRFGF
jgi:putative transposase